MILVHHLRIGRPIFTVWLLEELGLDYELKIYERDPKTMRAPPELKAAHPLGKSPVIEDGDLKLTESGAIAAYLIETYDKAGALASPPGDRVARARWTNWLHYPEGSAFTPLLLTLLLSRDPEGGSKLIEGFAAAEVKLHLDYIAASLGDQPYILGDRLQGPDIGLCYIVQMAQRQGRLEGYPTLTDYLARLTGRDAFQRALKRAGA